MCRACEAYLEERFGRRTLNKQFFHQFLESKQGQVPYIRGKGYKVCKHMRIREVLDYRNLDNLKKVGQI